MKNEKIVSLKGDVPESLRSAFKSLCAIHNKTMSEVLIALVREWMVKERAGVDSTDLDAVAFLRALSDGQLPDAADITKLAQNTGLDANKLVMLCNLVQSAHEKMGEDV